MSDQAEQVSTTSLADTKQPDAAKRRQYSETLSRRRDRAGRSAPDHPQFVERRETASSADRDPPSGQADEPGMERRRRIEKPKIARIVGDEDEIAVAGEV